MTSTVFIHQVFPLCQKRLPPWVFCSMSALPVLWWHYHHSIFRICQQVVCIFSLDAEDGALLMWKSRMLVWTDWSGSGKDPIKEEDLQNTHNLSFDKVWMFGGRRETETSWMFLERKRNDFQRGDMWLLWGRFVILLSHLDRNSAFRLCEVLSSWLRLMCINMTNISYQLSKTQIH